MSNVIKEIIKEHKGKKYRFPIGVKAENVETDENHQFVTKEDKKEFTDSTVNFTPVSTRTNIKSGEKLSVICGKIYRHFADLKAAAWCSTTDSVTSGKDADVTTRKALKAVDEKFGGLRFTEDEQGNKYVVGADSVPKKLGSPQPKKIIYRQVRVSTSEQPNRYVIAKSNDGNTVTYTENLNAKKNNTPCWSLEEHWDGVHQNQLPDKYYYHYDYIFDIKAAFPDIYGDLKKDNFCLQFTDYEIHCYHGSTNNLLNPAPMHREYIYDAANGKLRIKDVTGRSYEDWGSKVDPDDNSDGITELLINGFELWILA